MRRKTEFLSIGSGVLHSFVSRNSDIDGYWSIGKLYSYANAADTLEVKLNLLNVEITPPLSVLKRIVHRPNILPLATQYGAMLRNLMARREVPSEWLSSAIVTIEFNPAGANPVQPPACAGLSPFHAALELIDNLGQVYTLKTSGWCRPHNPWMESASTRRSEA